MKKSNKKIPKTHLPKFYPGGRADDIRPPVDNNMYGSASTERDMMGPTQDMGVGTQNIYNQGRKSKINAGQYAKYGQVAMGLGTQLAANQSLTGEYKQEANNKAISGAVDSTLSTVTPWYGYAKAGSDIGRSMIQRDENGEPVGKMNKQLDAVMKPQHQMAIDDASKGNYGLAVAEMLLPGIGYESRSNSLGLGKGINRMFKSDNDSNYQYAMGGMNMQPNAEVEDNEMITSNTPPQVFANGGVELASNNPYGTPTYKTNGASHENGGIPMNMAPGSIVNGKTKNPLTGNKFTKDIDILAKQENKFTKKAEAGDKYSKINAKLILPILAQKKDYLNNLQNAIIANNEQRKALNRGELPQPSMDNEQMEPQGQSEQSEGEYKYGGIHINPANKGKFTASAQRAGMGTQEFANHVLANKEDYSSTQVKRANFAHNAAGWKHEMGGVQLPYYNTDNAGNPIYTMGGGYPAMTNPYNNFKGSIPMYPDGGVNAQGLTKPQYEQAQRDSSVIYKSGLAKIPNYQFPGFTESSMREGLRINPRSPMIKTVKGQQYGSDAGVNMMDSEASNFSNFKPTMAPWKEYIPRTKDAGVDVKNVKPGMHPKYDHYIPGIEKSRQPVIIEEFSKGGKKNAKVPESVRFVPKMADESEGDNVVVPGVPQYETNYTDVLPPDRYNTFGKPLGNWEAARLNKSAWDEDYMNNPNAKKPIEETNPNSKNFNWGNLAMNVGNFAGQNMGNIYDLSRKDAPLQKYDRATASYLDATAAMRDANEQTRRAEYNVRGASGGNAGTYLANRVGLNAQNIMTKDRIRQQYANANAGIANQTNQFNTEIAYREAEARAKDAAMKENIRSQAIHGIGTSFGKATKSGKEDVMDQKTLEMYKQYYNNPQFRAALKKAGYDV